MSARARAHSTGRPPSKGSTGRQSPGRTRFIGILLILLSLISVVACCLTFALWLPNDRDHYDDYRAARACPAHPTARVRKNCLSTWHFAVVKTATENAGKTRRHEVTLKGEGSWRGVVDFEDTGPLFKRLKPGEQVTATVWRRDIVVLSRGGVRQDTSDAPRDALPIYAALGTLAGLVAVQACVYGVIRLARPRSYRLFAWFPYGGWMIAVILLSCLVAGITAMSTGIPWWIVPPAVPVMAGLVVWGLGLLLPLRRRRPTT
ncbi:hypothetical protein [Streptomyces sp. NBC_01497]|uniref:hypothetical protein n=1 Tax=Streptomyces sp. NBC_01497 TaxID=2903885 RepID=UPI002E2FF418|nr:hypothetical protein [Streptomyces sp. NBC_01497]